MASAPCVQFGKAASQLLALPEDERREIISELSEEDAQSLLWEWSFWARPNQLAPPGDWRVWLVLSGRGFGKTRMGAEWLRSLAETMPGARFALIGQTAADVRDVMIRGESGLLAVSPPWFRPIYNTSLRLVQWPNGAEAHTYSGDSPDQLRGPQHHGVWADEPAKWSYLTEAWDNMEMGLRLGNLPQAVATTTPRPLPLLRRLLADPSCVVTRGHTFENAENLPESYMDRLRALYEGTRIGRQELAGEILEDREGALWTRDMLERLRVVETPEMVRVVVAVDPAVSDGESAAETGIIVCGKGTDGQGYVLDDSTLSESPLNWSRQVIAAYTRYRANLIVGEKNQGGDLIENTLRTVKPGIAFKGVHASRNKVARAEPVVSLYEQGRVHHVGMFASLEDQLCGWVPGEKSPDRLDALVWGMTELFDLDEEPPKDPSAGLILMDSTGGWNP